MNTHAHREDFPESYPEIERAVLGACLLERSAITRIIANTYPEDFADPFHRDIFAAIIEQFRQNAPIDILTIARRMVTRHPDAHFRLTEITANLASSANLEYHHILLVQGTVKRGLRSLARILASDGLSDPLEGLDTSDREITRLSARIRGNDAHQMKDLMPAFAASLIQRKADRDAGKAPGMPVGIPDIDNVWGGLFIGDMVIFAGRPGMGKTAIALSLALGLAKAGTPVGFISLEMTSQALLERMVSPDSGVQYSRIRKGEIDDADLQRIGKATEIIQRLPITIDQSKETDLLSIKARLKQMADTGIKVVFIDYIQLISCKGLKTRYEIVSEVSRQLKQMALSLNLCIVPLAQLNREVEKQDMKRPHMANLKESGQIEQDADGIVFLWRPEYYGYDEYEGRTTAGTISLIVEKMRNGDSGYDIVLPCDIGLNRIGSSDHQPMIRALPEQFIPKSIPKGLPNPDSEVEDYPF